MKTVQNKYRITYSTKFDGATMQWIEQYKTIIAKSKKWAKIKATASLPWGAKILSVTFVSDEN